ncbi:MAG: hypothetical protein O2931_01500 [Planctomycetota bacterium]|nr:hypothetical protein [Planctomycetota bacterium]MDA1177448.1 hypothetical protein [Planctomycetota bacterium]
MAGIDIYQPCPGGCGKKIKFCCSKDLTQDLERLYRMMAGEQLQAARDRLDHLLRQYPGRNCLLALQVDVAASLADVQLLQKAILEFVDAAPTNPLARSYQAMLAVPHGAFAVMETLEKGMLTENSDLPVLFAENLVKLSRILADRRSILPALALLRLSYHYCRDEIAERDEFLYAMERSATIPLMERYDWPLDPLPEKVSWRNEMQMVYAAIGRGAWCWAVDYLEKMTLRVLDQPLLLKALGLCQAWVDQRADAAATFRKYSQLRLVSEADSLWGEVMSQQLTPPDAGATYDVVKREYEVHDIEGLLESFRLSPVLVRQSENRRSLADENGVLPRAVYSVIDRPLNRDAVEANWNDIPLVEGLVAVYGRETDRPARVVFRWVRDEQFEVSIQPLVEMMAAFVRPEFSELTEGAVPVAEHILQVFPMMPPRLSPITCQEVMRDIRDHVVLERWKKTPLPSLQNRTPAEVAQGGKQGVRVVAAAIKLLEVESVSSLHTNFEHLRASLGIPVEMPIRIDNDEAPNITPIDFNRIEIDGLSNEILVSLFSIARHYRMLASMRRFALELLNREANNGRIDGVTWEDIYAALTNTTQDLDESLQWVNKARQRAVAEGVSPAQWLVLELSLRFERREMNEAERLLREIERRHIREPGVEEMVQQVLSGIRSSMSEEVVDPELIDTQDADRPANLWTPDAGEPAVPQSAAGGSSSKLWLPGSPE